MMPISPDCPKASCLNNPHIQMANTWELAAHFIERHSMTAEEAIIAASQQLQSAIEDRDNPERHA